MTADEERRLVAQAQALNELVDLVEEVCTFEVPAEDLAELLERCEDDCTHDYACDYRRHLEEVREYIDHGGKHSDLTRSADFLRMALGRAEATLFPAEPDRARFRTVDVVEDAIDTLGWMGGGYKNTQLNAWLVQRLDELAEVIRRVLATVPGYEPTTAQTEPVRHEPIVTIACGQCGVAMPVRAGSGRRRAYCSDRCRQRAYRGRS